MWKLVAALVAAGIVTTTLTASVLGAEQPCDLSGPRDEAAGADCRRAWLDHNVKLNDLFVVGTHNSYKLHVPDAVLALIRAARPDAADEIEYGHRPLSEQLDAGARQLEIDIYHDPDGGRFLNPAGLRAAGIALDPARRAALAEPGFKVLHMQDVDVLSSCTTLRACLGIVRRWSLAHPDHAPILLLVNAKTDPAQFPGGTDALPFDAAAFDALDAEIRAVFPSGELITPDLVQGDYATLREAVLHGNWPSLGEARGKVMFALDEGPDKVALYRGARRSLEGRVLFVNTDETSPAAAYLTINDPVADAGRIRAAVAAGFIVRTRADAGTHEARRNDPSVAAAALASGAQFVSTDYLWPEARFANDYQVRLPGGAAALCNPVRAPRGCAGAVLDRANPQGNAYLTPESTPDGVRIVPPVPLAEGPVAVADRALFTATRRLAGSSRWDVAVADVSSEAFDHFACALGVQLSPQTAPALARVLDRASTSGVVDPVKAFYNSPRPYLDGDAAICQPRTAHLAANGDYPSGHAAGGWMEALILAELAPDRATELLARGRAFGESRYICGSHSHSAVEAGWLAGASATAALHASTEFRSDLEAARTELALVRINAPAPDAAVCRAEAAAIAGSAR